MTIYDDPNREAVGLAPIWADSGEPVADLDRMTKPELIEHAARLGVDVDDSMTKAEIREAIG